MFSSASACRRLIIGAIGLAVLVGVRTGPLSARGPLASVALFPVENLTSGSAPLDQVRQALRDRFAAAGVGVLDDAALEAFMARHRVRYAAGIDAETAGQLRAETGAEGVAIASVDLSSEAEPPKIGLFLRLVSTSGTPTVVWADDVSLAGDQAPGPFDLGVISDYDRLLAHALDGIGVSLESYLRTGQARPGTKPADRFRPKSSRRTLQLASGRTYSVAVLPFFNVSPRRNAGEIMALHFMRQMSAVPEFRVLDAGAARRQLLDARIIMDSGLSIEDAETVAAQLQADFVLAGRVLRYEDYPGPAGRTAVEFSTVLIERTSRLVVWSSDSYNEGQDGLGLFERGTSKSAHAMAAQMSRIASELIVGRHE